MLTLVMLAAAVSGCHRTPGGGLAVGTRPAWTPPPQTLLASPMKAEPVPGWRVTPSELGVPPSGGPEPTRFGTSGNWGSPLVGNDGDRAYFIASSPGPGGTQWWLTGVDVSTGVKLFNAVALNTGEHHPECFMNGPAAVLCLDHERSGSLAWVIDIPTGRVSYSGPTDLYNVAWKVVQAGSYALAQSLEKGVYGIGPQAQTTWFVPGDGSVRFGFQSDVATPILATQGGAGRGADNDVVLKVSDGTMVTPSLPEGTKPGSATVFPGGFAIALMRDDAPDRGVRFFDNAGNQTGGSDAEVYLTAKPVAVPTAETPTGAGNDRDLLAFANDGSILARIPGVGGGSELLFGTRLWVDAGARTWERYDLTTGEQLAKCRVAAPSAYVANDGTTGVFTAGTQEIGMTVFGMNLDTCEVWWTQTSPAGTSRWLWRINTTLVQESDDGTELMSLVAPS